MNNVLCVGEVLWDALPDGLFLGGAPINVAYHLHVLGVPVQPVSRVGADVLGREVLRRIARTGLPTDLVQTDAALPTGFVEVTLDGAGVPRFDIVSPSAWDEVALDEALSVASRTAKAIVFGSLAQRSERTRRTIGALCSAGALNVFDVNLRPPFVDPATVEASLRVSDVVKLNDQEMAQLGAWYGLPEEEEAAARALAARYGCGTVCVTRGDRGAALQHEGRWHEHPGYRVEVVDTVGSGDAFLAGLLAALLRGAAGAEALTRANRMGALVASRRGATPLYTVDDLAGRDQAILETHEQAA